MGKLQALYSSEGQSPWLDNLKRDWLNSGEIQQWIDRGVRGITSNPSIFQKAIEASDTYTEQFTQLLNAGQSIEASYWELVRTDIQQAADLLAPLYESSNRVDGYVSVEVNPQFARNTDATIDQARELWSTIDRPNVHIKIPGTVEGLPAITAMIGEGRNVNVTLIFSLDRYRDVIDAYISGLEQALDAGIEDLSAINSVASFFISRVDTEVDRRLESVGTDEALALRGHAAVDQAKLAYKLANEKFSGPRWDNLVAAGAVAQRPLWASTSTKNPAYPDTLYVDDLIGPNCVNTLPDATLVAFDDHGTLSRTIDVDVESAEQRWAQLGQTIDLDEVAQVLESEGVSAFEKSFDELLSVLQSRANELT